MSAPDCTAAPAVRQPSIYPCPFLVAPANLLIENICTRAQSLLARIIGGDSSVLIGLGCKQWTCRFCAAVKIKRLSWLTMRAEPNRLLTLTVDPTLYRDQRHAFDATRARVAELIRALRVRFGDIEYLRVTEATKKGFPHYHLLVRSKFLPQAVVKNIWEQLTGAKIVDLRQVTKTFGAYNYLTKYLTKMHNLDWTERHVSYSKKFFPTDPKKDERPSDLGDFQRVQQHPYEWLANYCPDQTLIQQAPMRWLLAECPQSLVPRADDF